MVTTPWCVCVGMWVCACMHAFMRGIDHSLFCIACGITISVPCTV